MNASPPNSPPNSIPNTIPTPPADAGKVVYFSEEKVPAKFGPTFSQKWAQWVDARRGMKKPKSWVVMFDEQICWLAKFDEGTAVEILSTSIRNGWTGLFEPKAGAIVAATASHGPSHKEVMNYAKEKWDHLKVPVWVDGFFRHWARKQWRHDGRLIEWQEELTKQVVKWRAE